MGKIIKIHTPIIIELSLSLPVYHLQSLLQYIRKEFELASPIAHNTTTYPNTININLYSMSQDQTPDDWDLHTKENNKYKYSVKLVYLVLAALQKIGFILLGRQTQSYNLILKKVICRKLMIGLSGFKINSCKQNSFLFRAMCELFFRICMVKKMLAL